MRGFRRCAANKRNLAALANSPEKYIKRVKREIEKCLPETYIGYRLSDGISNDELASLYSSVSFLENGNYSDIRAFMTATIITGYAYNGVPDLLCLMRPVDDYDIMRFWLMFATIKKYEIEVLSVQKHPKNKIKYNNIDLCLPIINDKYTLSEDEVYRLIRQVPSLHGRAT